MRVLFQNRPAGSWIGGDMVQMERTMEAVAKLGAEVEFDGQPIYRPALKYRHFDIIHVHNFSMDWTKWQIAIAALHNKPVVASMIYHESEEYVPYREQQTMLDHVNAAVFLTEGEKERVRRHLTLDESKAHVIGNGVDRFWFGKAVGMGGKPYVLTVGRVEPSKGQRAAAEACKAMGIRYVMVGERRDEAYAKACEAFGAEWKPPEGPEGLRRWYAGCAAFVLPSKAEIFPLTVMEAGAQGKPIVLTDKSEWTPETAFRCAWHDSATVADALGKALAKGKDAALKKALKGMGWDAVGKAYFSIYESML